jgi:tetratricopeptide (TPR) repeat protein
MAGKIECGPITLTYEVVVTKDPVDEQIAALHREATTHKGSSWDAAIACLKQAATLMRKRKGGYTINRWLRLPLFLQQAGYFDEAMREFEKLLSETIPRRKKDTPNPTPHMVEMFAQSDYAAIYDKMQLACKRQKLAEKAAVYAKFVEMCKRRNAELSDIVDAELNQRFCRNK